MADGRVVHVVSFPFPARFGSYNQDIHDICMADPRRNCVAAPDAGGIAGAEPYPIYLGEQRSFDRVAQVLSRVAKDRVKRALIEHSAAPLRAAANAVRSLGGRPTLALWGHPELAEPLRNMFPNHPIVFLQRLSTSKVLPYRYCDLTIFQTPDQVSAALTQSRQLSALVDVIPTGVDTGRFRPPTDDERLAAKERFRLAACRTAIFCPGSLTPHKGALRILHVADFLQRNHPGVAIHLAHERRPARDRGYFNDSLGRLIAHPAVVFSGGIDASMMPEAYWAADVVLLPYTGAEGLSRSALEAMATGCHVIASDVPGMPVVDKVTGRLLPVWSSARDVASACLETPEAERRRWAKSARAVVCEAHDRDSYLARLQSALHGLGE
jgi:glycosyltransferase involved in cell wall biosynthesis